MAVFLVRGGTALAGETTVQGAKNSVLPILAATAAVRGCCTLHNCPKLTDVEAACSILRHLGAKVEQNGRDITVNTETIHTGSIPDKLMQTMRSSVLFLGPVLARTEQAEISLPGGCELGPRPVDLHLSALRALGADVTSDGARIICRGRLRGGTIRLRYPSVGATENAMMAAAGADGGSTIENAAREPEICDLAKFLRAAGARIAGDGTNTITLEPAPLHGAEHTIAADRIVTATWLSAAAAAGGRIALRGARPEQLEPVLAVLSRAGARFAYDGGVLQMHAQRLHAPGRIETAPYPGFPTDAQAPVMAALLRAKGQTHFCETVFSSRYAHAHELRKLGANIRIDGPDAVVTGVRSLHGARMEAKDLRGGAAAVVGALGAMGESVVSGIGHIERGYEDLPRDLENMGACVKRVEINESIVYTTN